MADTPQIKRSHKGKTFFTSGLTKTKYQNLQKSIKAGLTFDQLTPQAKNVKGVEDLFTMLRRETLVPADEASEDVKSLFKAAFKYEDALKIMMPGLPDVKTRLRGSVDKPEAAEAAPAPAATAAPAPAAAAAPAKEEEEEKEDKKEVSDEVQEAMKSVSPERRKEIEKEVKDKLEREAAAAAAAPAAPAPEPAQPPAERKRPKESSILDPTPVTSVDLIPNERRSAEFKTAKQLRSDIEFFFESFPDMLEKEMREYIRVNKTSKKELSRFHRKIMGKLQPSESISPEQKKVGVVVSADEYIKQAINKALIDAKMLSMNPADVVELSVKGEDKKDDTQSYGSYEVKKSRSGKLAAQKEPIYRYVPKVNEEQEREPRRSAGLQLRKRETLPQTAKRQVRNNPFLRTPNTSVRLKYLY